MPTSYVHTVRILESLILLTPYYVYTLTQVTNSTINRCVFALEDLTILAALVPGAKLSSLVIKLDVLIRNI